MVFVCGGGPAPEVLTSLDTNHRISFLPNHHSLPKTEKKKKKKKKRKRNCQGYRQAFISNKWPE
jgi:hypothetical protein